MVERLELMIFFYIKFIFQLTYELKYLQKHSQHLVKHACDLEQPKYSPRKFINNPKLKNLSNSNFLSHANLKVNSLYDKFLLSNKIHRYQN